jgi:hypothetical protein
MTATVQTNHKVTLWVAILPILFLVTVFSMCLLFIVIWTYYKLTGTCSQPHIHLLLLLVHTDNIKSHFIKSSLASNYTYRKYVGVFLFRECMLQILPIWYSVSSWKCCTNVITMRFCVSRNWKTKNFVSSVAENKLLLFEQGIYHIQNL